MKNLILGALLAALVAGPARAAISFVGASGGLDPATGTTLSISRTPSAGDSWVVHTSYSDSATATVVCNPGAVAPDFTGTVVDDTPDLEKAQTFGFLHPDTSSCTSIQITISGSFPYRGIIIKEWSGVAAFGANVVHDCNTGVLTCTATLASTQDANNVADVQAQFQNYAGTSLTINSGTGRIGCNDNSGAVATSCSTSGTPVGYDGTQTFLTSADNTTASAGSSLAVQVTGTVSGTINMTGVELRSTTGATAKPPLLPLMGIGRSDPPRWLELQRRFHREALYRREDEGS